MDLNVGVMQGFLVALLAEGVDRNHSWNVWNRPASSVALLAEGVDRNHFKPSVRNARMGSPSSRRAWIEIRW